MLKNEPGKEHIEICSICKKRRKLVGRLSVESYSPEQPISGYWRMDNIITKCAPHKWVIYKERFGG